jgi:hypothetical protein
MRRLLVLLALALGVALVPANADAHPLGNFTFNHLTRVSVSAHRVDIAYTLDQAEIPTFQERGLKPEAVLARKLAEARRGLELTVDGQRVALVAQPGARIEFPAGQGGLRTTRVEARFRSAARGASYCSTAPSRGASAGRPWS